MNFEFLADLEQERQLPTQNWQAIAFYAKREAMGIRDPDNFIKRWGRPQRDDQVQRLERKIRDEPLTHVRSLFLREHFMQSQGGTEPDQGPHKVRGVEYGQSAMNKAGLTAAPSLSVLPAGSAILTLKFRLLSPLLTKDDDPFYLFDNPVRRDHIFGVPYLAAASVKGLSFDAYQRAFPNQGVMDETADLKPPLAKNLARTRQFRLKDGNQSHARRLFGLADDGVQVKFSQAGRLHFGPVWFPSVQYLVMNPMDPAKGIGTIPIQFEAIAPLMADGKTPVEAELHVFYFNPAGAPESDTATVRGDLARWLAAVAAWWPVMGLGAKRLAGYGAIEPVSAICQARDWPDSPGKQEFNGKDSWMKLAEFIAKGA